MARSLLPVPNFSTKAATDNTQVNGHDCVTDTNGWCTLFRLPWAAVYQPLAYEKEREIQKGTRIRGSKRPDSGGTEELEPFEENWNFVA